MANLTLAQRIAQLEALRDSGVLRLKNGDVEISYRSLEELKESIASLKAELEDRNCPRRRVKTIRVRSRNGY